MHSQKQIETPKLLIFRGSARLPPAPAPAIRLRRKQTERKIFIRIINTRPSISQPYQTLPE
jgi:hypothetical protein